MRDDVATIQAMPPEELDRLFSELKVWLKEHHGEQKKLANKLGVSEEILSHWIARRKNPGLKNYFKLQEFLRSRK